MLARPQVTRTLLGHMGDNDADERQSTALQRLAELTEREREVAIAVGAGASNAEVGTKLYMSEATVKAHVSRLLAKLDAANRVQVAILATAFTLSPPFNTSTNDMRQVIRVYGRQDECYRSTRANSSGSTLW